MHHRLTGPGAPLGGASPEYAIYPTADGSVALAALEPHFAARVHALLGSTHAELEAAFAAEPNAHWQELASRLDLPLVPVRQTRPVSPAPER